MAQNQQRVEQLLAQLVQPDTDKVNQATSALSEEFSSPDALLILLKILTTDSKANDIRQLAGVEARKRIDHLWPKVDDAIKPNIRNKLLEFAISDPTKLLRHSAAQIIAEMGTHDLENEEWSDLPAKLLQASNSPQSLHREMGLYIMLSLIMNAPDLFMSDVDGLVGVLKDKLQDPESGEVRLNALAIFAAIAPVLDVDDNPDTVATIQSCVPSMVRVLQAAIDSGEDDTAMKAFEAFQEILEGSPAFFQKHFAELIRFMIQIMANVDADADLRLAAVNFLAESVTLRKMKIQALKLGEEIAMAALKVVVEMDDFDDEGEKNPANQCLALIDLLAANLPPTQVVLPLLQAVGAYATNSDPSTRRAGILALSMCVEGAPDFFSTQLKEITPLVLQLLNDPETIVRGAALKAVARLAEDLSEDFGVLHESIIPGVIRNFDTAVQSIPTSTGKAQEDYTQIILDCCIAIDSMMDGMKEEETAKYIEELVPRFGRLLQEDNFKTKICALSATGAVAESAGSAFLPYFKDAVHGLGQYLEAKESTEDLELRRATTEAMGKIATAVGPAAFKNYVQPLMTASEEGLHLDNSGLKEQSYILWSQLAKVYKEDFDHFLEGVVKGLLDCLQQEEALMMGDDAEDKIAKILATMEQTKGRNAKDPDVLQAIDQLLDGGDGEEGIMLDDLDDFDGSPASGIALEKEIALEALGDVISHTKSKFLPYFPKTIEEVMKLAEHAWPGVIQSALGTLWRAYGTLWEIETERGMDKWEPGFPLKVQPSADITKLGDAVMKATLSAWAQQDDRDVVSDINRMLADTLTLCGPAPLAGQDVIAALCQQLIDIITKKHPCQTNPWEEDDEDESEQNSEYDWLVIETAMDCVVALAKAIGPDFAELWKMFEKPIFKYASATEANERSAATGTVAEVALAMREGVTPYTKSIMKVAVHRLNDEDLVAKGNAIYAVGLLCQFSRETEYIVKQYNPILSKLEPLLQDDTQGHLLDNSAGCVARMIIAHPDKVPLAEVLPRLIELAPAKEDWEVNAPIFQCIVKLYQSNNPHIRQSTPQVVEAVRSVLNEPEDHLDDETRELVQQLATYLKDKV